MNSCPKQKYEIIYFDTKGAGIAGYCTNITQCISFSGLYPTTKRV